MEDSYQIKAVIGLGNPGPKYYFTRHSSGFLVLDVFANQFVVKWQEKDLMNITEVKCGQNKIILIKPQTFMNTSGKVIPYLAKKGIKSENIAVVHDDLERSFGKVTKTFGGSAKGHNGLRSLISYCGSDFLRIRCGIGRPENREDVSKYVLQTFSEKKEDVDIMIGQAVDLLEEVCGCQSQD